MYSLKILDLSKNKFFGNLPQNLSNLVNLQCLDLHDNHITGNFQDVLPHISNLQVLILRNNFLQGFIPRTISNLKSLQIFDLSRNKLTENIPPELGNMPRMINTPDISPLDYDFCGLQYVVVNWKNHFHSLSCDNLKINILLDLSDNSISGEIPSTLRYIKGLKQLNISHNNISGAIPTSFGNLKDVESLDWSHNKLSGSIPQSLSKLDGLGVLYVNNNKLRGKIPVDGHMSTMRGESIMRTTTGYAACKLTSHVLRISHDKKEEMRYMRNSLGYHGTELGSRFWLDSSHQSWS